MEEMVYLVKPFKSDNNFAPYPLTHFMFNFYFGFILYKKILYSFCKSKKLNDIL